MRTDHLRSLGWLPFFDSQLDPVSTAGLVPARIAGEERDMYQLLDEAGGRAGVLAGRLRHDITAGKAHPPAVGDWVLVPPRTAATADGPAPIQRVLERRSAFSR